MIVSITSTTSETQLESSWQQKAQQCHMQGNYIQAASFYEQAIEAEPDVKSHYWHLGLMLLLQGQEEQAHTTWLLGMVEGESEKVEQWTSELIGVLLTEVERCSALEEYSVVWLIRQHIRELQPTDINNLLHLIQLCIKLEKFTGEDLNDWGVMDLLGAEPPADIDQALLLQTLQRVLEAVPLHPAALKLLEASLPYVKDPQDLFEIVLLASLETAYARRRPDIAVRLAELYRRLDERNPEILRHLAAYYQNSGQYNEGTEIAKLCYSIVEELQDKVFANNLILRGLTGATAANWEEVGTIFQRHESLLLSLIEAQPKNINRTAITRLLNSAHFFAPYLVDRPRQTRSIRNQVLQLCQDNVQIYAREQVEKYQQRNLQRRLQPSTKPLKIGYLSSCLRQHSVGWLARWLIQHHDRDRFHFYAYCMNHKRNYDTLHEWYLSQFPQTYYTIDALDMADRIHEDEIDILIDLDSLTLDITCEVIALKPAPIQITWLGWDASGIPGVDYFIADPYVLPESAQEYYTEKIWRLPQTYLAVDGFEIGVPTLRRDRLDIPSDAVVYYCGQSGLKHHQDFARVQMKILKEVPNSYLIMKNIGAQESIKRFFSQLAEEEGVDNDRLRFLPLVSSEALHRSNLGIVDVVLDTYPYNGATTTMETLWMGIPLITRVGEQFAARNSYSMMMNAGLTEGIAWTDEEYVEWGIRLGKDPALRQQIAWKLRASRQTSPLWNAEKFTREMENAYAQMWEIYLQGHSR